ncbi:MAG TPA: 3-deoxy-8-phosphooctulonate synthase, partial [Desulfobacteraceae bacterium]|nr:3-deoxy-8-phosphooctulonate synthase [Desulfobacteraceae bacterium]
MTQEIAIGNVVLGGNRPLALIAGPCAIEDEGLTLRIAEYLQKLCAELGIGLIFKASYDKANRTSVDSYRGPGIEKGLEIINKVK